MKRISVLFFAAVVFPAVFSSGGERVVVVDSGGPESVPGYEVLSVGERLKWPGLPAFAKASGVHPGEFPALVDLDSRLFVPVREGDLAAAAAELDSVSAEVAAAEQDSKPLSRKLLENEFFDLVDEIALAAGDPPPAEADAKDLGKVRAKLKKAKAAKDAAAGQGKKAKADDLLELSELRGRLLLLDAELSAEDPGWKKNAKRHVFE